MIQRIAIQNFTGGEISAWQLSARYDIAKYKTALKKVRNFICELHGDLRRRPGTYFCHDLGSPGALIPFRFSTDPAQNYAMAFQDKQVRFAQGYGLVLHTSASAWVTATAYALDAMVSSGVDLYRCISAHTSGSTTEPGTGASWATKWVKDSIVTVTTPYLSADLPSISYVQSGDTVYLAHRGYALRKLVRSSHTLWALSEVPFVPTIPTVTGVTVSHSVSGSYALRYVVCAENAKGEISLMGTPGEDTTAKHPTDWLTGEFCTVSWTGVAGAVRYLIYRESGGYYGLVGVVEANSLAAPNARGAWVKGTAYAKDDSVTTDGLTKYCNTAHTSPASILIGYTDDEPPVPIYRDAVFSDDAGSWRSVFELPKTFIDVKYEVDTADTPPEATDWFANDNNPGLVALHQQRLIVASAALEPQFFYASRTGSFEDWSKSRPAKDDDPLKQAIASGSIDAIQWLASFGTLLIGTGGAEYKAHDSGDALTTTTLNLGAQSYWGSTSLPPLVIGNSVLHLQRQGSHVRDLFYSLEKDGYGGNDLSVLAPHLFDNNTMKQWAYQQAPGCVVWVVRDDGVLLGMSYLKEHEIWGWHQHTTQGTFESVCSVPGAQEDVVYFIVKRTVGGTDKYYLERLATKWNPDDGVADAMFLDSAMTYSGAATASVSGLEHLEGQTVDALVDGSPHVGLTVTDGAVSFPVSGTRIHVGLPYTSVAIPMTPEADTQQGTTLGRSRAYGQCSARLVDSLGGQYGPDEDHLSDFVYIPEKWGEAIPPFTGDMPMTIEGSYETTASVCIAQRSPLPFTLAALMLEVDIAG